MQADIFANYIPLQTLLETTHASEVKVARVKELQDEISTAKFDDGELQITENFQEKQKRN